ncbi:poly(A) binding protein Pab2 [Dionaea muscipula]
MRMAQVQMQQQSNGGVGGVGVASPSASAAAAAALVATTSLYVGDLEFSVTDSQLYDLFNQVGQVVSVRVCRDLTTRRSLGYGYVNYSGLQDAARAMEILNFTPLNGKPIRIMYSHRDPSVRKSGTGNIFVKNLDGAIDNKALHDTFSAFGSILSCKVAMDPSGQSKGYGFVQYDDEESAKKAIEKFNGMLLNDKQVYVGPFLRKQERDNVVDKTKFNNVYVKNLSESTTDEDLKKVFGQYGMITSAVVMRDADGKSKGFGFVNFENTDDAARAVEALSGKKFDDKEWYVGKAQKKAEREAQLKLRFEQSVKETVEKNQGANLYIKNLDDSVHDDKLQELFSPFGTVTSCKVMRDPNGISRGSGFVAFSTADEASRALLEMNGKMIVSKPLYVALAQRKEDRRARLQAQFSQMHPTAMPPSVGPQLPIYSTGSPGLGQQMYYGQGPSLVVPPQPAFGYQQQLVPGLRPAGAPVPNFFVPAAAQQGQHPNGRRPGGVPMQQNLPRPLPLMQQQQQMLSRGRFWYPSRGGHPDAPPVQQGSAIIPISDTALSPATPVRTIAKILQEASSDGQRVILGENLYPLVEQLEPETAAKITGMLLEMDQPEVLHLLESPDALRAKVAEAVEVLKNVAQQQQQQQTNNAADHFTGLSLSNNNLR